MIDNRTAACYDLSRYPANFNFFEFLVAATTQGATHVIFDQTKGIRRKFTPAETEKRIASILEPGCALGGCSFEWGNGKEGTIDPGYHPSALFQAFARFGRIQKLRSVSTVTGLDSPPLATVTLRRNGRYPQRNSSREWERFAVRVGALVIDEYDAQPLHLHTRMAIYSAAQVNFFTANGPGILCHCSDNPYILFHKGFDRDYYARHGWQIGTQLPWASGYQRMVWRDDTFDNIMEEFDRWVSRTA